MSGRDIFRFKLSAPCIPFLVYESISNLKTKTLYTLAVVYTGCDKRQRENGLETVSSENPEQQLHLTDSVGPVFDIG